MTYLYLGYLLRMCLNLFERLVNCTVLWAVNVQVSHGGFPVIWHHTSSSNFQLREEKGFVIWLPASLLLFSGVKLSSDLLWSFPRLAQSPCLPNYWMEETAHHESDLFSDGYYPGQRKDWLRSYRFFSAMSSTVPHPSFLSGQWDLWSGEWKIKSCEIGLDNVSMLYPICLTDTLCLCLIGSKRFF